MLRQRDSRSFRVVASDIAEFPTDFPLVQEFTNRSQNPSSFVRLDRLLCITPFHRAITQYDSINIFIAVRQFSLDNCKAAPFAIYKGITGIASNDAISGICAILRFCFKTFSHYQFIFLQRSNVD